MPLSAWESAEASKWPFCGLGFRVLGFRALKSLGYPDYTCALRPPTLLTPFDTLPLHVQLQEVPITWQPSDAPDPVFFGSGFTCKLSSPQTLFFILVLGSLVNYQVTRNKDALIMVCLLGYQANFHALEGSCVGSTSERCHFSGLVVFGF